MHKETPFTSNAFYSSQDFSFAAYWFHPRTVWFLKSFFSKGLKWAAATRSLQFTKILNHHNHYSCSFHNIVRSDKLHRPTMLLKRRKTRFKLYTNPCGQLGIVGQSFLRKNLSPTVDYYRLSMMIALVPFNIIKYAYVLINSIHSPNNLDRPQTRTHLYTFFLPFHWAR